MLTNIFIHHGHGNLGGIIGSCQPNCDIGWADQCILPTQIFLDNLRVGFLARFLVPWTPGLLVTRVGCHKCSFLAAGGALVYILMISKGATTVTSPKSFDVSRELLFIDEQKLDFLHR